MKRMLADVRPELINEWSQRNLPLTPDSVTHGSNKIVWWKGKCGHEWRASVKNRVIGGSGCPYCSHNAILEGFNDLASQKPDLAAEWSDRNAPLLPTQVTVFANRKAWWKCRECGNEWETLISTRSDGSKCPYCSGYILLKIDLGVIFLENAVRVLAENGRMAIVLSNSIASIDSHKEARRWLCEKMRIVAIIDLPANIFAEAGVSPSIIIAYKPSQEELVKLRQSNYQVFSKEIKKVGYEVKTKNKVKVFETQYKLNSETFEKEVNDDGTAKLDEEFTETIISFKQWCNTQEESLRALFL